MIVALKDVVPRMTTNDIPLPVAVTTVGEKLRAGLLHKGSIGTRKCFSGEGMFAS